MKRCLAPVYPSPLSPHTAASMQRCLRIPSLSDCCCRLKSIKKLHFIAVSCLKPLSLTMKTAISIQASPKQFQLVCTNQLEKKQVFLITHANSINTAHEGKDRHFLVVSDLLSRHLPIHVQLAQHLRYQIARIYSKQGTLTGNMAASDAEVAVWQLKSWQRKQKITYVINRQGWKKT